MLDHISDEELERMILFPCSYLLDKKDARSPNDMADAYGELAEALKEERRIKNLVIDAFLAVV